MMEAAARRLFRLMNARTGEFPIALDRENDGALSSSDAGKRGLVNQVNGSFLWILDDRTEFAGGLQ